MDKFLERYSSAIEQAFGEYYRRHTSPEHLYQPVHYILSLGGKRLRPALVLLAADSFGCPGFFRISTCVDPAMIQRRLPAFRRILQD